MRTFQRALAGLAFVMLAGTSCADNMGGADEAAHLNPCAAKTINPCAAKAINPCAAKTLNAAAARTLNPCTAKMLNPCQAKASNPCMAKHVLSNPCMGKHMGMNPCNPCGAKHMGMNPCNPCGGAHVAASRFKQPPGVKVAASNPCLVKRGKMLWNDRGLGKSGLACANCHLDNYGQMHASFAKPYPHRVMMPFQQAGVSDVNAAEMVNFCMIVPMADEPLPWNSPKLAALTAYVQHIQSDFSPVAANPCGMKNPCNPCGGH